MDKALSSVRTRFTLFSVGIALVCALLGSVGMYALAESRLNNQINAAKIGELTASNTAVSEYLASQQKYHAHFETIAAAIQKDDRQQLTKTLPYILFGTAVVSGLAGWFLSRRLLVPVKESYLAQRRFMQDAAHELRNPLAAMKSMTQQAIINPPAAQKLPVYLDSMDTQLEHLSAITTDLLLLERREYPGMQQTDLVSLIDDILEELHHLTLQRKVKIIRVMPKQLVVTIDPHHFVYMAKNVIENAIKFSDASKPIIKVKLSSKKDGWELTVKDNGIGIESDDIANITQRFYRGKNATTIDGTGLGMAIVAKFVDIYKGKLHIKSSLGKGTVISIEI